MEDYNRIPEDDNGVILTSLVFYLTEDENRDFKSLMRICNFNNESDFIRLIIKNTYLYLNNKDRDIEEDISTILKKTYYKDLDPSLKSKLVNGSKEYDFFLELLRLQVIKCFNTIDTSDSSSSDEKTVRKSFRLTRNDEQDLRKIILGNEVISRPDFLRGYIKFFLESSRSTKTYILTYPNLLKLERAIKDKRYVIINNDKYKPYKIINTRFGISLLGIKENGVLTLARISNHYRLSSPAVEETELLFSFNSHDKELLNSFESLDEVTASFKNNKTDEIFNRDLERFENSEFIFDIIEFNKNDDIYSIKYKYSISGMENIFDKAFSRGAISDLTYSPNYQKFLELNYNKPIR